MGFKDVPSNHWAAKDIERAAELELLKGYPDDTFRPEKPVTRAETAAIAMRLYDRTEDTFEDLVHHVEQAVVTITNLDTGAVGSGSSIGRGFILTNAHVVLNDKGQLCKRYGISWTTWGYGPEGVARYAEGPCVYVAPEVDLAIVRADIVQYRDLMPVLPLGNPSQVRRGMPVIVVGSPLGLAGTVTQGIVSYVGRNMSYEVAPGIIASIEDLIQTDAPINPGNSGGALVNRRGELIGVPSVKLSHVAIEGLGFAIGLNTVRAVIQRAEASGALAMAYKTDLLAAFKDQGLAIA